MVPAVYYFQPPGCMCRVIKSLRVMKGDKFIAITMDDEQVFDPGHKYGWGVLLCIVKKSFPDYAIGA